MYYNKWYNTDMGNDDLIPDDHPDPNHEWDIDRQCIIAR